MEPQGLIPATVTPFDDNGAVDWEDLERHLRVVGEHDIFGIAVNGHAGEVLSLRSEERAEVVRLARKCLEPEKVVIAGIEASSTAELVSEAQAAADAGADGLLVLPPFDSRPLRGLTKDKEAVTRVFRELDQAVGLPMIVFQYPATSDTDYPTEVLEELVEIPSVVGIKAGTGDVTRYVEIHDRLSDRVAVLAASDAPPLLGMLLHGAAGALIGISVLGTDIWLDLVRSALRGDCNRAVELFKEKCLPLTTALFENQQPRSVVNAFACTKEALTMLGQLKNAAIRPPIVAPGPDRIQQISEALVAAGLREE